MREQTRHRRRALVAVSLAVAALAAGCGADAGERRSVRIFGVEVDQERENLQRAFDDFSQEAGIDVEVLGSRDFETLIQDQVEGGNPPDIAMFPQPGLVEDLADWITSLTELDGAEQEDPGGDGDGGDGDLATAVDEDFLDSLVELVTIDGELLAVPTKVDLKSLVWYSPVSFERNGYPLPGDENFPQDFDEFLDLADRMIANGDTPFCAGIESGEASGWPMTDWVEDFLLRRKGPETYSQWHRHDQGMPFDDPEVVEVAQEVAALWDADSFLFGTPKAAAAVSFVDAGMPLLYGDCLMYRMSNFYAAEWPDYVDELGPGGQVDAFFLPGSAENPHITLIAGNFAAAFSNDEDTRAVMEFIASPAFARARAEGQRGAFLSPNEEILFGQHIGRGRVPSGCENGTAGGGQGDQPDRGRRVERDGEPDRSIDITERFAEILAEAGPVCFDASDQMPSGVSSSFWAAAVDITTGNKTVDEAFAEVEASWPQDE